MTKDFCNTMPRRTDDDLSELEDALPPPRRKRSRGDRARPASRGRSISAGIGVILLVVAVGGFGWFLTHQYEGQSGLSTFSIPGLAPTNPPIVQVSPLLAAGVTLGHPTQTPALNQRQALVLGSQLEPDAAANAQNASAQYVLLSYSGKGTPAAQPDLNHVPAWMIVYQGIPLQPSDPSVDPTPFPQSNHDLYVFLDANTGKELLAIWV